MNLRRGSRSQRVLVVDGWNRTFDDWDTDIARGSLRSDDFFVTNTNYSTKKRTLVCSDLDRLDAMYSMVRVSGETYLRVSEKQNSWKGGAYQYVYQLRICRYIAELYEFVTTPMASGLPGAPVRTLRFTTPCDLYGVGSDESAEFDATRYARVNVFLPGDLSVDADFEIDINGETYDITNLQPFSDELIAQTLRRATDADAA